MIASIINNKRCNVWNIKFVFWSKVVNRITADFVAAYTPIFNNNCYWLIFVWPSAKLLNRFLSIIRKNVRRYCTTKMARNQYEWYNLFLNWIVVDSTGLKDTQLLFSSSYSFPELISLFRSLLQKKRNKIKSTPIP